MQTDPPTKHFSDRAVTVRRLSAAVVLASVAGYFLMFTIAFLDYCPTAEGCNREGAVLGVSVSLMSMLVSLVMGIVLCVWRLVRKRTAQRIAGYTVWAILLSAAFGIVVFAVNVGMF